jgi:hypothetical protein
LQLLYGKNDKNWHVSQNWNLNTSLARWFTALNFFLFERGIVRQPIPRIFGLDIFGHFFFRSRELKIYNFFPYFFCIFACISKTRNRILISNTSLKSWQKKPFEWVYICWNKLKQNSKYLLPKLTLSVGEISSIFYEILTLNTGTGNRGGC